MSIKQISEAEQLLATALRSITDVLKQVTAERDESRRQSDLQMNSAIKFCSERNEARIERDKLAAELKSLRDSEMDLPDPEITYRVDSQGVMHVKDVTYSESQLRDYGDRMAIAERGRLEKLLDTKVGAGRSNPQRRNEMK